MAFSGKRTACPRCRAEGKDSTGNHLSLWVDGLGGYCNQGGHGTVRFTDGQQGEERAISSNYSSATDLAAIGAYPIRALIHKPIPHEIAERFGVRVSVNETDASIESVYYPYTDMDGTITGYKKRRLAKEFSVVGKLKGLFGQYVAKNNARMLCIFEGEDDALSAATMFAQKGKNYACVSIPNGANEEGIIDQQVRRELEWIVKHETVLICYDMDGPGQKTAKAMAELIAAQTKVGIVNLPLKDAGEMLKAGRTDEFYNLVFNSKPYRPESVVEGKDLKPEDFRKSKSPGVPLKYPKLQKMSQGLRKGEITLVVAGPGLGKSTFVRELCYDLSLHGHRICNIALETPMEDLVNTYIAMDNNVPAYKLMFNQDIISNRKYEDSFDKLYATNNMLFFSWWGNIASDMLIAKMHYYVKSLGADFIMLDHVSIAVTGEDDERLEIDRLFEKLTKLVVETGVGVIAVMHLRKVPGKSFNRGGVVELEDIRGSAGAAQMSWNVWGLERDQHGDRKDIMQVRVLKSRTIGFTGEADLLRYDSETGRLEAFEAVHP